MRNGGIAALCALVALVAGLWLGGHPESLPGPVRDAFVQEDRALRAEIVDSIEDNFYKPVDEKKLDDASLKGIVESLDDPYSHYLTPQGGEAVRRVGERRVRGRRHERRGGQARAEGAARVRRLARARAPASAAATSSSA